MADRRHHAVANDWASKFYLTNATQHKYQSRRCVVIAIEMMFQALEHEELPYFEYKGKPEFWAKFKEYWESARLYMVGTEKSKGLSAGINDKHPNTNKLETNSRILKEFWDYNPRKQKDYTKLNRKNKKKVENKGNVLTHKDEIEL